MSSHFDTYLQKVHSHSTDHKILTSVLTDILGWAPCELRKIVRGESHEVYEAQICETNTTHIVRISPSVNADFTSEAWAMQRVSQVGVPVPRQLKMHTVSNDETHISLEIYPKIPGSIVDIWDPLFDSVSYKPHVVQAGEYLRLIHSIPTSQFGPINSYGVGHFNTFIERVISLMYELQEYDYDIAQSCLIAYSNHVQKFARAPGRLIHGDFGPKHFVIDNHSIDGIIDWEGVESGPYYMDFGRWSYYYQNKLPLEWLLEGYGATVNELCEVYDVLPLIELFWGCHSLLFYRSHNYPEQADEDVQKITTILRRI